MNAEFSTLWPAKPSELCMSYTYIMYLPPGGPSLTLAGDGGAGASGE